MVLMTHAVVSHIVYIIGYHYVTKMNVFYIVLYEKPLQCSLMVQCEVSHVVLISFRSHESHRTPGLNFGQLVGCYTFPYSVGYLNGLTDGLMNGHTEASVTSPH